jgi:hypothetical protein
MTEEEEKKLALLEKRLVANIDLDDQALNILDFGTDIYYMLGHVGWVQFSNGVSANTHKEFGDKGLKLIGDASAEDSGAKYFLAMLKYCCNPAAPKPWHCSRKSAAARRPLTAGEEPQPTAAALPRQAGSRQHCVVVLA